MLVLVAAIQTPCLCFTHTGTTAAVICPVSHSLLVATHMVGVHQISYQLSHGSGSFPNQLWMQQHCMWNWGRQPSYKISWWQFDTVPLQTCTFWIHTLKATSCTTQNWWREQVWLWQPCCVCERTSRKKIPSGNCPSTSSKCCWLSSFIIQSQVLHRKIKCSSILIKARRWNWVMKI